MCYPSGSLHTASDSSTASPGSSKSSSRRESVSWQHPATVGVMMIGLYICNRPPNHHQSYNTLNHTSYAISCPINHARISENLRRHASITTYITYILESLQPMFSQFLWHLPSIPIQPPFAPSCAMPRAKPPGTGRPKRTKAQATLQSPVTVNSGTKLSAYVGRLGIGIGMVRVDTELIWRVYSGTCCRCFDVHDIFDE